MHHVPGGPVRRGHAGAAPARSLGYKRQVECRYLRDSLWEEETQIFVSLSLSQRGKVVGRGREKWRKGRDEEGANRARKRTIPGQSRWEDEGAVEEVEEEAERRIE